MAEKKPDKSAYQRNLISLRDRTPGSKEKVTRKSLQDAIGKKKDKSLRSFILRRTGAKRVIEGMENKK